MSLVRIGVLGARGRMGEQVTRLIETEFKSKATLAATCDRGEPTDALAQTDVVIDFSSPEALLAFSKSLVSQASPPALVVGSTGWKLDGRKELEETAKKTPVLMSSNFSLGVLAMTEILKMASPLLEKLGYTPVIVDTHHRHKKDAPSGTALSLQRAISPAGPGNVQTHSVRAGEIIGDHEVTFYGTGDHLTVGHFAQDRSIFARGAIDAAIWLSARRAGYPGGAAPSLISMDTFFKERIS